MSESLVRHKNHTESDSMIPFRQIMKILQILRKFLNSQNNYWLNSKKSFFNFFATFKWNLLQLILILVISIFNYVQKCYDNRIWMKRKVLFIDLNWTQSEWKWTLHKWKSINFCCFQFIRTNWKVCHLYLVILIIYSN